MHVPPINFQYVFIFLLSFPPSLPPSLPLPLTLKHKGDPGQGEGEEGLNA